MTKQQNTRTRPKLLAGVAGGLIVCGTVVGLPRLADSAPAKAPTINARSHYVRNVLYNVIADKVSAPGGKLTLDIVPTAKSDQGYFESVTIGGAPLQIKKLRVTEFNLRATNVRVDVPFLLSQRKVNTLKSTTVLRAVVTEDDLTYMLSQGKVTAGMGLKVKYMGDRIHVSGDWKMSWFNGPIAGTGKLRLAPGNKVNLDIISLQLNGAEVPQWTKNKFMEKLNPVIDYNDVPFQPKFKALKMVGPKAILSA